MMKVYSLFALLIALTMSSCQNITATQLQVLGASHTPSLMPSYTPTQSPTAEPARITYTITPTITPKPTPSQLDIAEKVLTELNIGEEHTYSPNGMCTWTRLVAWSPGDVSIKYNNQYFMYATISCANQEKPWVLVSQWNEQGLGYPLTSLLGWSADGKSAYFYDTIVPDGCQVPGGFQQDLRKVDLSSGKIHPISLTWTGGMTLSPDTTKVVYYDKQTDEVGVYDLAGGKEQRLKFELPKDMEYWYAGNFTWSPDGQRLLFIIQYGDPCVPTGVSLRLVDLQSQQVTTVLERQNQTVSILEWANLDHPLIKIDGAQMEIDLNNGNAYPMATPMP
jgi:hypothetical protein